jgi:hemerythrin superfamily protein
MQIDTHRQNHELGVFAVLIAEHRQVAELFERIDRLDDPESRATVFELLARELLAHSRAEQAIVYDRLDHSRELETEIGRARKQHAHVEHLIAEARDLDPEQDAWARKIEELRRWVEQHVEEEERDIIPRAHLVIDDRTVDELQVAYRYEKDLVLRELDGEE